MTLKQKLLLLAALAFGLLLVADCMGEDFGTDLAKAQAAAKADGKNLIIAIGADW